MVPGRDGSPGPGSRPAPPDGTRRGGRGGQELPVVGRDRGLLRRGRPGGRPAVGRGPLRPRRSLRRAQLHAGGGQLPRRRGPLARRARGGSRPLHRGRQAPGGRAGTAPRHGVTADDGAHPGGLRPRAVHARPGSRHRTGTRARRRPRCARPGNSGWRRSRTGPSRGADDARPAGEHRRATAGRGTPRSAGTRRSRPWPRQSRRDARTRAAPSAGNRPAGSATGASARS